MIRAHIPELCYFYLWIISLKLTPVNRKATVPPNQSVYPINSGRLISHISRPAVRVEGEGISQCIWLFEDPGFKPGKNVTKLQFQGFRHIIYARCWQNSQIELGPVLTERSPFSASKYMFSLFFFNSKKKYFSASFFFQENFWEFFKFLWFFEKFPFNYKGFFSKNQRKLKNCKKNLGVTYISKQKMKIFALKPIPTRFEHSVSNGHRLCVWNPWNCNLVTFFFRSGFTWSFFFRKLEHPSNYWLFYGYELCLFSRGTSARNNWLPGQLIINKPVFQRLEWRGTTRHASDSPYQHCRVFFSVENVEICLNY